MTTIITVNGKIGSVAWIEEFGATKVKGARYYEYQLELADDDNRLDEIRARLNEAQEWQGEIWWDEESGWDVEFHLEQICKLAKLVRSEKTKEQLRTIYRAVRSEGAAAWELHRGTLMAINARRS